MYNRLVLCVFCFFLIQAPLQSQEACDWYISGIVISSEDQQTIPLATVELLNTNKRIVTDSLGRFSIPKLCDGTYQMLVRFIGYQMFERTVVLEGSKEIEIRLVVKVQDLEEVMVEAKKVQEIVTLSSAVVSKDELFKRSGESLGKSLQSISGINLLQSGPNIAKPIIHGLHSNRILILNNGIRQEGQQWGQEHAPEIDPFVATNLQLIKGAAAVKYGSDAIGGVILVNPPDLPEEAGLSGSINVVGNSNNGLVNTSAMIEGGLSGLKGFGWRLQGSVKKAGDARAANYRLTNTGTKENNFSLGLGYHNRKSGLELFFSSFDAEIGILRSAHTGNLTDLERAIGSERPFVIQDFSYDINNPRQAIRHQLFKFNGHTETKLGEFSAQYGLQVNQREEYDIRRGGRSEIPALSLELITHTIELDLDMKAQGAFKGDVGASFLYQGNSNNPETGIRPLIPNFNNWTAGVHAIGRYIKESYELELGVRYDFKHYLVKRFDSQNMLQTPEFDFNNITGSAGVILFFNQGWNFRSNLGTAWRAPQINELFSGGLHSGSAGVEEGNALLVPEKAIKWINSLERISPKYDLTIAAYYNLIADYIYLRPENVILTIQGAFPLFSYTQTDASFIGIDTDFTYHLSSSIDFNGKLSLIKAEDRLNNGPLINIPANRLNTGVTFKFKEGKVKEPYISLAADFVDKQRNAPRVVSITEVIAAKSTGSDLFQSDNTVFDFLAPPEGYINLGLSTGFKLPVRDKLLAVYLAVDNMFNNSYRDYLNRLRYFSDDMGRNFSIKLNYTF
jgi:iron complex outermembrane receptor protein